jgi:hypothetical protein
MLALQAVFPDISAEEAPPSGVGRQDITHVVSVIKCSTSDTMAVLFTCIFSAFCS